MSGDFDHDGFPDLAGATGTEPSELVYLFGNGKGNFTMQVVVGPEGYYVATGDFNGDGIPDLVVPDRFSFVSLELGQTNRKDSVSPLALSPAAVTDISTGDINGDGFPEIFVGGDPIDVIPGTVFMNNGNGTFQFGANTDPTSFMIADLTGKGVVDLMGGSGDLEIWPNNGTPNFSSSPITISQPTGNIAVKDMDGDSIPDIISACPYGESCTGQIFYGDGAYKFSPVAVTGFGWPYVIGDFNGDGKPDIATGSSTFLNTGSRTFQAVQTNSLGLANGSLAVVGDFNGDGKDDVAINLPGEQTITIYYSNGDGTFYQGTQVDPGQYPGAMVVGDFNGDGKLDLAVGLMLSQQVCILFNSGGGQFTRTFYASGASAILIAASDLNHDGKPDLVIGNFVLGYEPLNIDVIFHQ
ncbi:MAG: VCBS repeat-containing protein [Acidobacteriaceae bacterium]